MDLSINSELLFELGSLILSVLGGLFFSFFLKKKIPLAAKKWRQVLTDSKMGFFLGLFLFELFFLPILSFTFEIKLILTPMVLFAAGVLVVTRLVRIFSKSLGGYLFTPPFRLDSFCLLFLRSFKPHYYLPSKSDF